MRLIDADIAYIVIIYDKSNELTQVSAIREYIERQKAFLDKFPTIDAVPVVWRYKCKHFKHDEANDEWYCKKSVADIEYVDSLTHFCSYGERKEGADNG